MKEVTLTFPCWQHPLSINCLIFLWAISATWKIVSERQLSLYLLFTVSLSFGILKSPLHSRALSPGCNTLIHLIIFKFAYTATLNMHFHDNGSRYKHMCFIILTHARHWSLDMYPLQLLQPHYLFKPRLPHINVSVKFKVSCPLYWAPRLPHGDGEWRCISTSAGGPQSHLFTLFTPPSFSLPLLSKHSSTDVRGMPWIQLFQMCVYTDVYLLF